MTLHDPDRWHPMAFLASSGGVMVCDCINLFSYHIIPIVAQKH